ncbi:hypothetical protein ACFSPU_08170 [Haoranjiania flava]|uniref:Uncharacterized protein n=1 Tax=Haoranjiania flava TaxID=1856322 RepID=A0AAE3IMI5_9BACT|nr:hypothetical protein [Haoranjiania flava]MCU7694623.1 hypothetical protein [Haoranjiania flava]
MKIYCTFVVRIIKEDMLYAVQYVNKETDCFQECFDKWNDIVYLEEFFENNKSDLSMKIEDAICKTLYEAAQLENKILDCISGLSNQTLDNYIFLPLHKNDDYDIPLLQSKAYGKHKGKSFLRLYAIRLKDGCYLITGGALKLTATMQERQHTQEELEKLKQISNILRKKDIFDSFDIGILIPE